MHSPAQHGTIECAHDSSSHHDPAPEYVQTGSPNCPRGGGDRFTLGNAWAQTLQPDRFLGGSPPNWLGRGGAATRHHHFAVWFTYDAQSVPTLVHCNAPSAEHLFRPARPRQERHFHRSLAQPTNAIVNAGTGTLTQTAGNRLSLYTVGAVTQTKPLWAAEFRGGRSGAGVHHANTQWQQFPRSTDQPHGPHWGGASNSGWGAQISHQGNTVFFGWYTYGTNRNATWMTGQGTVDANNPRRVVGTLYSVNPGIPFSQRRAHQQCQRTKPRTFELLFTDGERGSFIYSVPSQSALNRSPPIERFALAGGQVQSLRGQQPGPAKAEGLRLLARAHVRAEIGRDRQRCLDWLLRVDRPAVCQNRRPIPAQCHGVPGDFAG